MQQKIVTCNFTASFPPTALSGRALGIRAREDNGGGSCNSLTTGDWDWLELPIGLGGFTQAPGIV
jgi:hypothetical protein